MTKDNMGDYQRALSIATANNRRAKKWTNRQVTWEDLVERLKKPTRTRETVAEYRSMTRDEQSDAKDVGGFVGGYLVDGSRKKGSVQYRDLLTLDFDTIPEGVDILPSVEALGYEAVIYQTHSHTAKSPRLRVVWPLASSIMANTYGALAERVAEAIGLEYVDKTSFEPERLMFWPSASQDVEATVWHNAKGPWLDANQYTIAEQRPPQDLKTQKDPREKDNIIGAFCRVYDIDDAIAEFLSDRYTPTGDGRYTYVEGSTSGGLVLYEGATFAYSYHATDPASGKLCNAFDLVRLHLYGELDAKARPKTPSTKLPSFLAMVDKCNTLPNVKRELAEKSLDAVLIALKDDELNWTEQLDLNSKGHPEASIKNITLILENHPGLKDNLSYDTFKECLTVLDDLPWQRLSERISDVWTDKDDSAFRELLERGYKISNGAKTQDAIALFCIRNTHHPVRDYLEGLQWDGTPRLDSLLIDYMGAEDSDYTRTVTRKSLVGAVARIMEPGCKHDHVLVLVGPQGAMKSTLFKRLGGDFFSDSMYTVQGKEAYEQIQGVWLIEMAEMSAMKRAEVETMKQFISKQVDTYRAAYARRAEEHPRQCAFFGTTNDVEFLKDQTGSRRFWPVTVTELGVERVPMLTQDHVDQLWAEAVALYTMGETWHLDRDMEALAREEQEKHTEQSAYIGLIREFLDKKVPRNWYNLNLGQRKDFYFNSDAEIEQGEMLRDRVCALEIWQELFDGRPRDFTQLKARIINDAMAQIEGWERKTSVRCGTIYGTQRAFVKIDFVNT